ncbi:MAG TPA: hypothetical protein VEK85_01545 [Gemmatimonadales bacterium]|nr:hypothetical protein [Gemmatimonadales bacterium]
MAGSWVDAILAAGAVPASYVPDASAGRTDVEEFTGADLVEDAELRTRSVADARPLSPGAVGFLDGIEQWRVVGYGGVTPIVRGYVAAAVRRRGPDRRLRTGSEQSRELAITRLESLAAPVRRALETGGVDVVEFAAEDGGQPARAIQAARRELERARLALERELAERCLAGLGPDEWLVVDGVLSDSVALSAHPRAVGVIKSHGAQYFEGAELERALTLPAGHRTSVFEPRGAACDLFLVPPVLALGRQRPAVRPGTGRSARAPRHARPRLCPVGVARARAVPALDARRTLGPPVVSYT